MKSLHSHLKATFILALLAVSGATQLSAQTSFTYQGRLNVAGAPADGWYDFQFRLLDDPTNGTAATAVPLQLAVPVANGLFTTTLDFGPDAGSGAARWLEINVRSNATATFTTLGPRQLLTPTPVALHALSASNLLGTLPASQLAGVLPANLWPTNPSFAGALSAGSFAGSGAGLTNVNASQLGGLSAASFWQLSGNTGTSINHFLGTTDNQSLRFKVNGQLAYRLEPASNSVNVIAGGADNRTLTNFIALIGSSNAEWPTQLVVNAVIAGGSSNLISGTNTTIGGGSGNKIIGRRDIQAVMSGLISDVIYAGGLGATIGGGISNVICEAPRSLGSSTIGGGRANKIYSSGSSDPNPETVAIAANTIGGGGGNGIGSSDIFYPSAGYATISGGGGNFISGYTSADTIGGGSGNGIGRATSGSTIGGGGGNYIEQNYCTIAGGSQNKIPWFNSLNQSEFGFIGGGYGNQIIAFRGYGTICGGYSNFVGGAGAFIGGGGIGDSLVNVDDLTFYTNSATGRSSVIVGGTQNFTSGSRSAIGGGHANSATNSFATVPGGSFNTAGGLNSFAAGQNAQALHSGAFVWSDTSATNATTSSTNDSVTFRAAGGYRLFSNSDASAGVSLDPGSTAWAVISDRNVKKDFAPIDSRAVLEKLAALPITQWHYNWEASDTTPNIGPMAQDFKAAFYPGRDDKKITTQEADGVALAAIQGLNAKLASELKQKDQEIAELNSRLNQLSKLVNDLAKQNEE